VARSPFLTVGVAGLVLGLAWMGLSAELGAAFREHWSGRAALLVAINLLRPFSVVATWIDPYLRTLPEWVDVGVTIVLGLAPYLVLDAAYRRLGRLWGLPGRRGAPDGSGPVAQGGG
jgi:hypothetical protein